LRETSIDKQPNSGESVLSLKLGAQLRWFERAVAIVIAILVAQSRQLAANLTNECARTYYYCFVAGPQ